MYDLKKLLLQKMTSITEELVRKKAEHNEGQIGSLEELALYQSNIMKIDCIQNWCKDLKILYLQNNVISRIENLSKLKKLEYLNLALNNIECIENLDGCESLRKLDLTLNFIGLLTSVQNLKNNYNLRELYLTGNPCWNFKHFREYVIVVLPQLELLNGTNISPSERILASQNFEKIEKHVTEQQNIYLEKRKQQKHNCSLKKTQSDNYVYKEAIEFWNQTSENTPETRLAMAEEICKTKRENLIDLAEPRPPRREIQLFRKDGRSLNVNEAGIPFQLDDERDRYVLTVNVYKHVDTNLLEVDVQPWFVRVLIKGKILQLTFDEEVHPDNSSAQRISGSGRLVITIPKFHGDKIIESIKNPQT